MIEGLILLIELAAVGLLLWTVQRQDMPGARPPTDLFAYRDPDRVDHPRAAQAGKRSKRDA